MRKSRSWIYAFFLVLSYILCVAGNEPASSDQYKSLFGKYKVMAAFLKKDSELWIP